MKKILLLAAIIFVMLASAGCGGLLPQEPAITATYPPPITTEPQAPPATPTPTAALPTEAPTAAVSPTPFNGMDARVTLDGLFLREGPGFLHPALEMYNENDHVEAWGRAPGWSWVYVKTADDVHGWMKLELLELAGDYYDLPEVTPDDFVIVKGHVYTPSGDPASHITLSLTPPGGDSADEDAATTDNEGRFYFFLPDGSRGTWTLAAGAYGCESSAVNASCSLVGAFPPAREVDVVESGDVWINLQIIN